MEDSKRDWWSENFTKFNMHLSVAAIEHGHSVNKNTKVIRRKITKNTIKHILKKNIVAVYEERFVLCMLRCDQVVEC